MYLFVAGLAGAPFMIKPHLHIPKSRPLTLISGCSLHNESIHSPGGLRGGKLWAGRKTHEAVTEQGCNYPNLSHLLHFLALIPCASMLPVWEILTLLAYLYGTFSPFFLPHLFLNFNSFFWVFNSPHYIFLSHLSTPTFGYRCTLVWTKGETGLLLWCPKCLSLQTFGTKHWGHLLTEPFSNLEFTHFSPQTSYVYIAIFKLYTHKTLGKITN